MVIKPNQRSSITDGLKAMGMDPSILQNGQLGAIISKEKTPADLKTILKVRKLIHGVDETKPIVDVRDINYAYKSDRIKIDAIRKDIEAWSKKFYHAGKQTQGHEAYEAKHQVEKPHGTVANPATIHTPTTTATATKGRGLKHKPIIGRGLPKSKPTYGSLFSGQVFKQFK